METFLVEDSAISLNRSIPQMLIVTSELYRGDLLAGGAMHLQSLKSLESWSLIIISNRYREDLFGGGQRNKPKSFKFRKCLS